METTTEDVVPFDTLDKEDRAYVRRVVRAYLDAPEYSEEERLLDATITAACERLHLNACDTVQRFAQ